MKLSEKDYFAGNFKLVSANGQTFETVSVLKLGSKEDFSSIKSAAKEKLNLIEFDAAFAGCAPDDFDESFLASLREVLKEAENSEAVFCIKPVLQVSSINSEEDLENITALFYHIARRIKDCACVAGFALPEMGADTQKCAVSLIEALKKKHPEYVYILSSMDFASALNETYPARLACY